MPSADVKGLSGSGLSGAREHKERPLTSSQPQMLLSEADTPRCRLLPLWRAVPPRGLGGNMGQGTGPLWGAGAKPLALRSTHTLESRQSIVCYTSLPKSRRAPDRLTLVSNCLGCYGSCHFPFGESSTPPLEKGCGRTPSP